jgi:steroid delta-isomerase-like uncharacterized protein
MAEQNLINVARENLEAYNAGDWQRLKASLATDVVYHDIGGQRRTQGADQLVETYQGWKKAGPDSKGTITNSLVSGNTVVFQLTWTGTQTGPLQTPDGSFPASGKTWNAPGAQVILIENEKIKELFQYYDALTILQQLGVVQLGQAKRAP